MRFFTIAIVMLPLLVAHSNSAMAELGGTEASVVADQTSMKATKRILSAQKYTVHEIQLPNGTFVREFVSPQGQVFGVAWQGPFMPDLRQVLGNYFADYSAATGSKRAGRGPALVRQPGLVVRSGGHMRSFSGMAYIPQLLPKDVTIDEIK